jgi:hypothetical protein
MTIRLTIRPTVYRGEAGFSILGRNNGWPIRVFTRTREGAEAATIAIKSGNHDELDSILLSELPSATKRDHA